MKGEKWFFDAVMVQQNSYMARVLARDKIDRFKRLFGAEGKVGQVSDRSGGDVEFTFDHITVEGLIGGLIDGLIDGLMVDKNN